MRNNRVETLITNYIEAVRQRNDACDDLVKAESALSKAVRCPICKRKGSVHFCFGIDGSYVMCYECQLCSGTWKTPEKAIEFWKKIGAAYDTMEKE